MPRPEWIKNANVAQGATAEPKRSLGPQGPAPAFPLGGPLPKTPAELEAIRKEFAQGMETVGGFAFIAGFKTTGVVIQRRAQRASFEAIAYAQQYEGVMRAVVGFNTLMKAGTLAELGSHVAMGVGVDVGALHPAKPVKLGPLSVPGFVILQPIEEDLRQVQHIQETAEAMAREHEQQRAATAAAVNGGRAPDATATAGAE